jgi:hypothetical protein
LEVKRFRRNLKSIFRSAGGSKREEEEHETATFEGTRNRHRSGRYSHARRLQEEDRATAAPTTAATGIAYRFHLGESGYDSSWSVFDFDLANLERYRRLY